MARPNKGKRPRTPKRIPEEAPLGVERFLGPPEFVDKFRKKHLGRPRVEKTRGGERLVFDGFLGRVQSSTGEGSRVWQKTQQRKCKPRHFLTRPFLRHSVYERSAQWAQLYQIDVAPKIGDARSYGSIYSEALQSFIKIAVPRNEWPEAWQKVVEDHRHKVIYPMEFEGVPEEVHRERVAEPERFAREAEVKGRMPKPPRAYFNPLMDRRKRLKLIYESASSYADRMQKRLAREDPTFWRHKYTEGFFKILDYAPYGERQKLLEIAWKDHTGKTHPMEKPFAE